MKPFPTFIILFGMSSQLALGGPMIFDNRSKVALPPVEAQPNEAGVRSTQSESNRPASNLKSVRRQRQRQRQTGKTQDDCGLQGGNLPKEFRNICHSSFQADSPVSVVAEKQRGSRLGSLRIGDRISAYVEQSIKASPNLRTPVRAIIQGGIHDGGILHGYASLDPVLKRVIFDFEHLRTPGSHTTYQLAASGHALNGQIGIEGDYNSGENKYVATAFAVDFAAAMLDTSVQRNTTVWGTQVPDQTTVSNRLKQSSSVATAKEGERLLEKARNAPEWTEIPGGQEIQVFINSDVTEELNES